jgi:hypothetical protein
VVRTERRGRIVWRYNHRDDRRAMFETLLDRSAVGADDDLAWSSSFRPRV